MKSTTIKELRKGDFFTLSPVEYPKESQVYIRGMYDVSQRKYECYKFEDVNEYRYYKGNKSVYTDFIF